MPTWKLKIEKGQKKECRMVNLRLQDCETQISNFDTETSKNLRLRDAKSTKKKTLRQTLLRFRDLAKI